MITPPIQLPKLIAHRGASEYAPENTLAALYKAHELGAKWVEFDVMLARYGTPIIFHDEELERTTDGQGKISFTSYKIIKQLDAGFWFDQTFRHERVPTLAQWLQTCAELKLGINLEMKVSSYRAPIMARTVVTALSRYWSKDLPAPLISSQNKTCLREVHRLNSTLALALISDTWLPRWQLALQNLHCVSLNMNHRRLTEQRVKQIKDHGYYVLAYTINDAERANQLLNMGVDAVFTNNPLLLG